MQRNQNLKSHYVANVMAATPDCSASRAITNPTATAITSQMETAHSEHARASVWLGMRPYDATRHHGNGEAVTNAQYNIPVFSCPQESEARGHLSCKAR
jgi:hypothetical protein